MIFAGCSRDGYWNELTESGSEVVGENRVANVRKDITEGNDAARG